MAQRLARWQRFHEAIGAARATLPIRSPDVLERLREYEEAYAYMSPVIGEALGRWQASRSRACPERNEGWPNVAGATGGVPG